MTDRVARLRRCSLDTKPWLSMERAALLTEFYRQCEPASTPVLRARALHHILEHRTIYIGPEELIVGERGPGPKGTPTYPELCCHSMEDLEILDTREKISYRWTRKRGASRREGHSRTGTAAACATASSREMDAEWKDAYEAGIFTEFMEQRAPGHTVLGDVIYRKGLLDLKAEIAGQPGAARFLRRSRGVGTSSRS